MLRIPTAHSVDSGPPGVARLGGGGRCYIHRRLPCLDRRESYRRTSENTNARKSDWQAGGSAGSETTQQHSQRASRLARQFGKSGSMRLGSCSPQKPVLSEAALPLAHSCRVPSLMSRRLTAILTVTLRASECFARQDAIFHAVSISQPEKTLPGPRRCAVMRVWVKVRRSGERARVGLRQKRVRHHPGGRHDSAHGALTIKKQRRKNILSETSAVERFKCDRSFSPHLAR